MAPSTKVIWMIATKEKNNEQVPRYYTPSDLIVGAKRDKSGSWITFNSSVYESEGSASLHNFWSTTLLRINKEANRIARVLPAATVRGPTIYATIRSSAATTSKTISTTPQYGLQSASSRLSPKWGANHITTTKNARCLRHCALMLLIGTNSKATATVTPKLYN
ncbi:hypothetical protein BDZ45DRAFT_742673 [Acephala macrosclerotiorum]|nr:hypothetical protein BDZ45DRAFT_742673 [Acephala macrosclerotiorum]